MFELREYSVDEVPVASWAIKRALEYMATIEKEWAPTPAIVLNGPANTTIDVNLYTQHINRDFWAARVSYHQQQSYGKFRKYLMENHTANEARYIESIESYRVLTVPPILTDWNSAVVRYRLPGPLSARDMAIWLTAQETVPEKQFLVLSLPRRIPVDATKGIYVSIELVELLDNGTIKWTMAQTSDAGGWLPKWAQRKAIAAEIAKDVPTFLTWLRFQPPKLNGDSDHKEEEPKRKKSLSISSRSRRSRMSSRSSIH